MGQEAWRVAGLPLPFANHKYKNWLILYQNATEFPTPFEGGTIALAMGNSVDPPTSTSFSCTEHHHLANF